MSHGRGQGFYTRVGFGFDTSFGGNIAASGNVSDDLGILAKASTERERHFFGSWERCPSELGMG